ncbi:hypothetical protein HK102_008522 [Quaeritorhiza haematococci]|nr:hypothetical protein HK102_008522 [Quaeritorhiza haematococci]
MSKEPPSESECQRLCRIATRFLDEDVSRTWKYTGDNEDAQTLFRNAGFDTVHNIDLQDRFAFIVAMHQYLERDAKLLLSKNMKVEDLVDPAEYLDEVVNYCKFLENGLMLRKKLAEVDYEQYGEYEEYGEDGEDGEDGSNEDGEDGANEDGKDGEDEGGEDRANKEDGEYEKVGEERANEVGEYGEDGGDRREDREEDIEDVDYEEGGENRREDPEVGEKDGEDGEGEEGEEGAANKGEEYGANKDAEDGEYREDDEDAEDGEYKEDDKDAEDWEYREDDEDAEDGEYREDDEDAEDGEYTEGDEDALSEDWEDEVWGPNEDAEVRLSFGPSSSSRCQKRKRRANPKSGRNKRRRKDTPKRIRKSEFQKISSGEIGAHFLSATETGVDVLTYVDTSFTSIIERPSKESIERYWKRIADDFAKNLGTRQYEYPWKNISCSRALTAAYAILRVDQVGSQVINCRLVIHQFNSNHSM